MISKTIVWFRPVQYCFNIDEFNVTKGYTN